MCSLKSIPDGYFWQLATFESLCGEKSFWLWTLIPCTLYNWVSCWQFKPAIVISAGGQYSLLIRWLSLVSQASGTCTHSQRLRQILQFLNCLPQIRQILEVLNCLRSPGLASQLYFSFPVPPGQKGWGEKIIIQLRGSWYYRPTWVRASFLGGPQTRLMATRLTVLTWITVTTATPSSRG